MIALHKAESGFLLAREAEACGLVPQRLAPTVMRLDAGTADERAVSELCFAWAVLFDETEVQARNGLSSVLAEAFCRAAEGRRFDGPWPLVVWDAEGDQPRRLPKLEGAVRDGIRRAMSRVAKLSTDDEPSSAVADGLGAVCVARDHAYVSSRCWFGGQRRMKDDPGAPSRSYLKIEEAYRVLGAEPKAGETVADLGAAPGGWSYSAAKRGARVVAVDNGALKGAAATAPAIEHVRDDAFLFRPERGAAFDWLFCDMVETPSRVLGQVEKWVVSGWCRRFVVNLKIGRVDPIPFVNALKSLDNPIRSACSRVVCRELYHDREEITVAGIIE